MVEMRNPMSESTKCLTDGLPCSVRSLHASMYFERSEFVQIISSSKMANLFILRVLAYDFDRDIAPVLRYLVDIGVGARNIAEVASNAPMLFQHSVQVWSRYAYYTTLSNC